MVVIGLNDKFVPFYETGKYFILNFNKIKISDSLSKWNTQIFQNKLTFSKIKEYILDQYNKEIDKKILNGFKWNGYDIWLSSENQFNYKAAYDLAIQTQGATLPVTFKFGTTENPQYHTFETLDEFTDFYTKAIKFINDTLAEGWQKKDSIDWSIYEL